MNEMANTIKKLYYYPINSFKNTHNFFKTEL